MEREQARIIPWVFHKEGSKIGDYRKAWKNACDAAHLPGKLFHALRRTAVRNLERADMPRSVAMKLTGHKVDSVSRRSAIVPERDLREGVSKLAEPGQSRKLAASNPGFARRFLFPGLPVSGTPWAKRGSVRSG